jgi:hypothetical protein
MIALKYYNELQEYLLKDVEQGRITEEALASNNVEVFLAFALHTICKIDYKRIGILKRGKRIRKGASGTRDATCDLTRVPPNKRPKGPPLSQAVLIRYYDLTKSRKDWRSFRRTNFISINAVWSDVTKQFTTDFASVINDGTVPPLNIALSRTDKRKLHRVLRKKRVKKAKNV